MGASRFGQLLLGIGGAVGVAAVIGLVIGFEPAALPPALVNIAVYKLTFAAAAGLLAAGAIVRRYARRDDTRRTGDLDDTVDAEGERPALGEGPADGGTFGGRQKESARVHDRP